MPGKKATNKEVAQFKVLSDLGVSNKAIARRTGRHVDTVRKYLNSEVYLNPDIDSMVHKIRDKEIDDLILLGGKARAHLNKLLDEGKTKAIETVAIMDRSFQQRRLLEEKSTNNITLTHEDIQILREYMNPKKSEEVIDI
ncbi:MAG: hypothetical protein M0P57_14675 [Syntrophales bacterium]|jgi:pyrimidine operon attenuation protein/uracil phosphoribosyltransferase|nr:hypothetical protein [Syntrophales bacterium]